MIHAFRTFRTQHHSSVLLSPNNLGTRTSIAKFRQISTVSCKPASQQNMDKADAHDQQNEESGDLMSQSFGEGYATRSDEEGFGGIYRGNQSDPGGDPAKRKVHESHPDYDKKQGSEVKEKEKSRHQKGVDP